MEKKNLLKVALRYRALFLDTRREDIDMNSPITPPTLAFVRRLKECGFTVSEELLHALNAVSLTELVTITDVINDVMGMNLNWMPLVKGWNVPTGESLADHLVTFVANIFGEEAGFKGTALPCGHLIPDGTFPIERYNGCPFCGTPFATSDFVYKGQGSKQKALRLFTDDDLQHIFATLLASTTPLDATQKESLSTLLAHYPLPEGVEIGMKETVMLVTKQLVEKGRSEEASRWMKTPTDILRFLWFEKTGHVQIIEPKTLIAHARRMYYHMWGPLNQSEDAGRKMKEKLMLKYDRRHCQMVAAWLNALPMSTEQAAENMNPKRGMWVRMIRALRLGEYSRRKGYERLAALLDVFYKQTYTTWQGNVDKARSERNAEQLFALLKQRPGLFARCLFATMLRFGSTLALEAFGDVADKLPARLLLSLANAAENYFDRTATRAVRPVTGATQRIAPNALLKLYDDEELKAMVAGVMGVYTASMLRRFAAAKTEVKTIYIDPMLFNIPLSVGDRAATVQDTSCALMGTRFPVEGDAVRIFLQWGKGMHAQPIDLDLSCRIAFAGGKVCECAYYNLTCVGAKHSGDIRAIPEMVGTAEYIELNLPELETARAKFVTFTANAYSCGALSPNAMVGWMDSAYPMQLSAETGVAYDPSCVQHMVRISDGEECLAKGLVFGVLDVIKREIIWLEMPFSHQTLASLDSATVEALIRKLEAKCSIGQLLQMKAEAQHLEIVSDADSADEKYTYEWALNPAEVSLLLNI